MSAEWVLRLYDNDGNRTATFDQWPELQVTTYVNAPAVFALRLDGNDPRVALFEDDAILEGWWCDTDHGIDWRREFCGLCVDRTWWTDGDGAKGFQVSGFGLEDVLARTIIDVSAGTPESDQSAFGERCIKNWVDQEVVNPTTRAARPGITIEAMHAPALGANWDGQRSNRNLLVVCQQIAEASQVQFGIERTADFSFEFRVWEATDRRTTVRFSEAFGNMAEPKLDIRRSAMANWIKAGGEGAGTLRDFEYADDAVSIALSPWGRREWFVNASDSSTGANLAQKAADALVEMQALTTLAFTVLQMPATLYGLHYFVGDLVTAIYNGVSYDRRIESAAWRVRADGAWVDVTTTEMP